MNEVIFNDNFFIFELATYYSAVAGYACLVLLKVLYCASLQTTTKTLHSVYC